MEIVVGSYEEFLIGYTLNIEEEDSDKKYVLSRSFTNHNHKKSVRCITGVGKFLASGGADETINIVNLQTRVEHGSLQHQDGTITCIANFKSSHLFSGSADGTICIWKTNNWLCEKSLMAHKGGVLGFSVHPSGKLALSIGADRSLKTWNLIKGRTGFVTNLHGVADAVKWSPSGTFYAVSILNRVDIYSLQYAKVIYSAPFGKRASVIEFFDDDHIFIAGDKEEIEIHDIKNSSKLLEFKAHKNRVKDVKYVNQLKALITVSNDGFIKMWSFSNKSALKNTPTLLTETNTSSRITCVAFWSKDESQLNETEEEADEEMNETEQLESSEDEDEEEVFSLDSDDDYEEKDEEEERKPEKKNQKPKMNFQNKNPKAFETGKKRPKKF